MEKLISFFDSNFFQTLAVFIGGFIALFIYIFQEEARVRDAAVIVCLEIESIMSAINRIKLLRISEDIFQTSPVYQYLYWFEYRNALVGRVGKDNVDLINKFYNYAITCEEARRLFQDSVLLNRNSKIMATQEQIPTILKEETLKNIDYDRKTIDEQQAIIKEIQIRLSQYEQLYGKLWNDFIPKGIIDRYENAINAYKDIEPIAYQKLKK